MPSMLSVCMHCVYVHDRKETHDQTLCVEECFCVNKYQHMRVCLLLVNDNVSNTINSKETMLVTPTFTRARFAKLGGMLPRAIYRNYIANGIANESEKVLSEYSYIGKLVYTRTPTLTEP